MSATNSSSNDDAQYLIDHRLQPLRQKVRECLKLASQASAEAAEPLGALEQYLRLAERECNQAIVKASEW